MGVYKSCNCRMCKLAGSASAGAHKRRGHRLLRQLAKKALRAGKEAPVAVSTGYRD